MLTVQTLMAARWAPRLALSNASCVVQACRDAVAHAEVTGGLLFDGECFMQLLRGPEDVVRALVSQWLRHPLLSEARVLAERLLPGPLSGTWQAGFVEVGVLETIRAAPSQEAMMAAFMHTLSRSDAQ